MPGLHRNPAVTYCFCLDTDLRGKSLQRLGLPKKAVPTSKIGQETEHVKIGHVKTDQAHFRVHFREHWKLPVSTLVGVLIHLCNCPAPNVGGNYDSLRNIQVGNACGDNGRSLLLRAGALLTSGACFFSKHLKGLQAECSAVGKKKLQLKAKEAPTVSHEQKTMTARDETGYSTLFSPPRNRAIFSTFGGRFLTKLHRKPGEKGTTSTGENRKNPVCRGRRRPEQAKRLPPKRSTDLGLQGEKRILMDMPAASLSKSSAAWKKTD